MSDSALIFYTLGLVIMLDIPLITESEELDILIILVLWYGVREMERACAEKQISPRGI